MYIIEMNCHTYTGIRYLKGLKEVSTLPEAARYKTIASAEKAIDKYVYEHRDDLMFARGLEIKEDPLDYL